MIVRSMMMLRYDIHALVQRIGAWRSSRKAVAEFAAMLRRYGFVKTGPGCWEKSA
jgi:hypothetical protein